MKIIKNILSNEDNTKIIAHLINCKNWMMAYDNNKHDVNVILEKDGFSIAVNKKLDLKELQNIFSNFKGMSMITYGCDTNGNESSSDPFLNNYAEKISKIVCKKANIKKYKIVRYFWNFYRPLDVTDWHVDRKEKNYISFVYNLHDSDGGTEIGKKIYYDKEGEAKIFKSNIKHRGLGPKKFNFRLNLNCILQL